MRVLNPKFDNINASTLHFLSHLHSYLVALSLRYACFFDHPEKFFRSPRVVLGVCLRGGFVRILCTRINVFPPCDLETRNLCAHPRRREPFARCRRRYSGWMDFTTARTLYPKKAGLHARFRTATCFAVWRIHCHDVTILTELHLGDELLKVQVCDV